MIMVIYLWRKARYGSPNDHQTKLMSLYVNSSSQSIKNSQRFDHTFYKTLAIYIEDNHKCFQ